MLVHVFTCRQSNVFLGRRTQAHLRKFRVAQLLCEHGRVALRLLILFSERLPLKVVTDAAQNCVFVRSVQFASNGAAQSSQHFACSENKISIITVVQCVSFWYFLLRSVFINFCNRRFSTISRSLSSLLKFSQLNNA